MSTRTLVGLFLALVCTSIVSVSAHVIVGRTSPTLTTAFVSSPSAASDAPIRVVWSATDAQLRVACFNAANTSPVRVDRPGWPRITGVGFELPGSPSGFALMAPLNGDWELIEDVQASIPGHASVTLDFAIRARVNPTGRTPGRPDDPRGIPPGQPAVRGSGTRFCVSGPFPDLLPNLTTADPLDTIPTTIEALINGVVVAFDGVVGAPRDGSDVGVWDNPARIIPMYP
jgi:hypothetical protein